MHLSDLLASLLMPLAMEAMESGFQLESFEDRERNRPILIDWWYPTTGQDAIEFDYGFGTGHVVPDGEIESGQFPLLLLSHGAMSAARNYSWLAERLARAGFVVAGISHFGESYDFGAQSVDPSQIVRHWERPLDISAALTHIESSSPFARSVDRVRIGFVGHSSGGATAMYLAGAQFDAKQIAAYCNSSKSTDDRGCDYARSDASAMDPEIPVPDARSYTEPRITAFVSLDPALGPGFTEVSEVSAARKHLIVELCTQRLSTIRT